MIAEMTSVAVECLKNPRRRSVYSPKLGQYVCPDSEEGEKALAAAKDVVVTPKMKKKATTHPPINPQFKLVFLTAAIGTLLFLILCVTITLIAGKEPPPLMDKFVTTVLDLVKIGFGAIVGMLGGKVLQTETPTP